MDIPVLVVRCWVSVPFVQKAPCAHLQILSMAAARSTQLSSSALLKLLSFILRCLWHRRTAVVPVISRSTAFLWQCPTVHLGVRNVYPGPTSHGEIIPSWLFPSDHACVTTLLILSKQCDRAIGQLKTRAAWAQGVWGMKITHCHKLLP